tara:strand:+ start:430 stop:1170 length:741 start_codon:yes stop_codon:yes gene_type:complete
MVVRSLVFHVIVLGSFVIFSTYVSPPSRKVETLMVTKLVKLGKKRPDHLLPRIQKKTSRPRPKTSKTPPKTETKPPKVETKPKAAAPAPKAESSKQDSKDLQKKMSSALERLRAISSSNQDEEAGPETEPEEPEGDPDGSIDGEVSDAAFAVLGSVYATKLKAAIMRCYTIEGLTPSQVQGRTATLWARVNHAGIIVDFRIEKTSGLNLLDGSLMKAVKNCSEGPVPPEKLRKRLYTDGIAFNFTP